MSNKQIFVTDITDVYDVSAGGDHHDTLGDIRWVGNKCYKYVQVTDAVVTLTAGMFCYYLATPAAGYNVNVVTCDISTADATNPVMAGLTVSAIPTGDYGWIQIKGAGTMAAASNCPNGAIGDPITWGADDSDAAVLQTAAGTANATAAVDMYPQYGILLSTTVVNLDCPY